MRVSELRPIQCSRGDWSCISPVGADGSGIEQAAAGASRVGSAAAAPANIALRSWHLLQRPQCNPSRGASTTASIPTARRRRVASIQASCSRQMAAPESRCPTWHRSSAAAKLAKNSAVASANGLFFSVPSANRPTPLSWHQSRDLTSSNGLRPGQINRFVGRCAVGLCLPSVLQCWP